MALIVVNYYSIKISSDRFIIFFRIWEIIKYANI